MSRHLLPEDIHPLEMIFYRREGFDGRTAEAALGIPGVPAGLLLPQRMAVSQIINNKFC